MTSQGGWLIVATVTAALAMATGALAVYGGTQAPSHPVGLDVAPPNAPGILIPTSSHDPIVPGCAVPNVDDKCRAWDGEGIFLSADPVNPHVYAVGDQLRSFDVDTGEELWVTSKTFLTPRSIEVSPDGATVFVADLGNQLDGSMDAFGFDASTGDLLWSIGHVEIYTSPMTIDLAASPDAQTVYVSTTSRDHPRTGSNVQLHALDARTGSEEWTTSYNGPQDFDDFARTVEVTPDGSQVIVAGDSLSGEYAPFVDQHPWEPALVAFDAATGEQRWEARYSGPGEAAELPSDDAMAISQDGERIYIAGRERMAHNDKIWDFFTVAYDAETGKQEWVTSYRGTPIGAYESVDWLTSIAASPAGDDRVYVTGATGPLYPDAASWATVAYDGETGDQLWAVADAVPGAPSDVAVGPNGDQVYVFGVSSPAYYAPNRFTTVAYDAATGEQTWAARMATTPGDTPLGASTVPAALEVAGDGSHVLVGGTDWAPGTGMDQMIVAYETGDTPLSPVGG